jgi:adenine-specific DNA glycosylase
MHRPARQHGDPRAVRHVSDAAAFAAADPADLEKAIHSTGFFRNKAKAIKERCADIVAKHGGEVPRTLEELTALRGVGRKTANVVLGNAYGIASGIVVDTHVGRLANRMGLTNETDAVKTEFALMPLVPRESWTLFSHLADPARPRRVQRPQAAVQRLPGGRPLPAPGRDRVGMKRHALAALLAVVALARA